VLGPLFWRLWIRRHAWDSRPRSAEGPAGRACRERNPLYGRHSECPQCYRPYLTRRPLRRTESTRLAIARRFHVRDAWRPLSGYSGRVASGWTPQRTLSSRAGSRQQRQVEWGWALGQRIRVRLGWGWCADSADPGQVVAAGRSGAQQQDAGGDAGDGRRAPDRTGSRREAQARRSVPSRPDAAAGCGRGGLAGCRSRQD